MTKARNIPSISCPRWLCLGLAGLLVAIVAVGRGQIRQPMKVKLNVAPSVNVSRIDASLQRSLTEDFMHLNELSLKGSGSADSVILVPGFSIAAYENISVLVSVETPVRVGPADEARITCGYLNDGTTYFRRSTITNRSSVLFRLRNRTLLKHSLEHTNPLFEAYVFFLVHERKEATSYGGSLPISTVTVEIL